MLTIGKIIPIPQTAVGPHYTAMSSGNAGGPLESRWWTVVPNLRDDGTGRPGVGFTRFYGLDDEARANEYATWMNSAATEPQWKKGDKVLLRMGSDQVMTVKTIDSDGRVVCTWPCPKPCISTFKPEDLTPTKDTPTSFKVGDVVVKTKGGNYEMTVEHIMLNGTLCLSWLSDSHLHSTMLNAHDLVIATTIPQWKKGEKVELKPGTQHPQANGPVMTVESTPYRPDGWIRCSWAKRAAERTSDYFDPKTLMIAK